jgi:pyrroloquinoline quinone biosynthesis protein D
MNETAAITANDVVEINPLYFFRWEEPQQAYVLLYPEGVVKVNETAAAILKMCDGKRNTEQIVSELSDLYTTDVSESVYKFLEVSHAKGWIRRKS